MAQLLQLLQLHLAGYGNTFLAPHPLFHRENPPVLHFPGDGLI
jgi:hypothetical protein